jgi:hypothetical protein
MKRTSYVVVCDKQFENGLKDVDKVIAIKNLGSNTSQLLYKHISCVMGVVANIEETYGLDYSEILEVLHKIYKYTVIDKSEMIEPNKYSVFDTFYAWEFYAQKKEYASECESLIVDGVEELLRDIINRSSI